MLGLPLMLNRTPRAPSILMSSSWLFTACIAASTARCSPLPCPMAISAEPPLPMIDRTSLKSTFTRPVPVMRSDTPWMPCRSRSSAAKKASLIEARGSMICSRRSLGITTSVSTFSLSRPMPSIASAARLPPSKPNGRVTTETVNAPISLASPATIGAAPVPVPPPMPAVTKTMSAPCSSSLMRSTDSSAAFSPSFGSPPHPRPRVTFSPSRRRTGACELANAWPSVFRAMNSTPRTPTSIMRSTAFDPPPPTPTTLISALLPRSNRESAIPTPCRQNHLRASAV